jgi:hypothetical protein
VTGIFPISAKEDIRHRRILRSSQQIKQERGHPLLANSIKP